MKSMISYLCKLSLLLCLCFFMSCAKQTIINNVKEREANKIIVILSSKNINAVKIQAASTGAGGGSKTVLYNIQVDKDSSIEAMAILNKYGLPKKEELSLLSLFSGGGLVPSAAAQKIRYREGLAAQIASVIQKIDGVIDANVQPSFPESDAEGNSSTDTNQNNFTASVYVKHDGILDDPNSHLVTKIKRLVASSIDGLSFERVTVITDKARFVDINLTQLPGNKYQGEKEYIKVWGLVIEKNSIGLFRFIFFTLIALLVLFFLFATWLVWKILPVFKSGGTIKDLFSSEPFNITHALAEKESSDKDDDASSENDKQQPTESFEDENSKDIYKEDDNDELDKDEDESSKE